jgi:Cbb3-type cytochrome oxidase, subunit 1
MIQTSTATRPAPAEIDRSVQGTVLFCFGSAIFWLLAGCLLHAVAGAKLVMPGFLDGIGFLTYGRVLPAATNAIAFGWASLSAIGVALWLCARLNGAMLRASALIVSAVVAWNAAVLVGVLAILAGSSTGIPGLEMPGGVSVVLLVAYLPIGLWALSTFRTGAPGFVSQWYLVAALLAFPWLYTTANALLVWQGTPGSAMGAIFAWFDSGFFGLWLLPIALAAAYYFLPRAAGRPVFSRGLASLGFWTLVLCAGWMGTSRFQGGPIPAWMVSAGVVAAILLILPAIAVSSNLYLTIGDACERLWMQTPARFLITSAVFFLGWVSLLIIVTLPPVNSIIQFSLVNPGLTQTALHGIASLAFIGVLYALLGVRHPESTITPRSSLVFWLIVTGVGLILCASFFGGFFQGFALSDPIVTFANSITYAAPFRWVELAGHLCLLAAAAGLARDFAEQLLVSSPAQAPKPAAAQRPEVAAV